MAKPRKNELISCKYFIWKLVNRGGKWYADGRSNSINVGRSSLGTACGTEALELLRELDEVAAAQHGLIPRDRPQATKVPLLTLEEGRQKYERHIRRPREMGGVRASTQKRYRTVFDKFIAFAKSRRIVAWNEITNQAVTDYATHLRNQGYAGKTLRNEVTTLVTAYKWLMETGSLQGTQPLRLKMKAVESQRAYCYTPEQVEAMADRCRADEALEWLRGVIVGLACTGLRISELASLHWTDIDLEHDRLALIDESGRSRRDGKKRRELKSGRSRHLSIHRDLKAVLQALPRRDAYVFHGLRGGRIKPDTVRRILVRDVIKPLVDQFPSAADEQGFKDGRLHSFRHYFASMCATSGVPERVAMEWLGHQDSEMVRHYFHLHDAESRRQMERLNPLGDTGKRLTGE
jgi:integrase